MTPAILGAFGPAQLACIRSWSDRGYRPLFIHLTAAPARARLLVRSVHAYLQVDPARLDEDATITRIAEFLARYDASGVVAVDYRRIDWLWSVRDRLPASVELWVPARATLDLLQSKQRQTELAQRVGLDVAPTWHVGADGAGHVPDEAFPLVLRPDDPHAIVPAFKVHRVDSTRALAEFVATFERLDKPLLAQSFIDGQNLVVHGVRAPASGQCLHAAFLVERMFEGVCLTIRRIALPDGLEAACRAFVEAADMAGIYHFEFRHCPASGKYVFLDFNGRLGGTTGKALRCGFDEPGLLVDAFRGGEFHIATLAASGRITATNKLAMVKVLLCALNAKLTVFDYPDVALPRRLADLLPGFLTWRDEIWVPRHWRSSFAYLAQMVATR